MHPLATNLSATEKPVPNSPCAIVSQPTHGEPWMQPMWVRACPVLAQDDMLTCRCKWRYEYLVEGGGPLYSLFVASLVAVNYVNLLSPFFLAHFPQRSRKSILYVHVLVLRKTAQDHWCWQHPQRPIASPHGQRIPLLSPRSGGSVNFKTEICSKTSAEIAGALKEGILAGM